MVLCASACGDDGSDDGQDEVGDTTDADTTDADTTTDSTDTADDTTTGDSDTGVELLDIDLHFAAAVGDQPAACGQSYEGIGSQATTIEIQDLRFFVHDIALIDGMGQAVPLTLAQDGLWQYETLALLDFEDGSAACQDGGTAELNAVVVGTIPDGDYVGIRFTLGVPFALNHHAVDAAPSPLNLPSMFWNWQGGYKFARVDLLNDNPDSPAWYWHQGSTGCESAGPMEGPTEECARPNRLPVEFTSFDVASDTIVLDLAMLLDGVDVSQNTMDTAPGCMSGVTDPECIALFPKLGLDLDTGACIGDCSDQQVFRVQ